MVVKAKKAEEQARLEYIRKQEELAAIQEAIPEEKSASNSTAVYENQKREDFNSELDLYSEIDSAAHPGSRRQNLSGKNTQQRKNSPLSKPMRVIPAEDSENEKSSLKGSQEDGTELNKDDADNDEDEDGDGDGVDIRENDVDDSDSDDNNRESAMNERKEHKKTLMIKEQIKKEEEELCGHRLTRKIDDFIFQVSVEAGLADPNDRDNNGNNALNNEMLQTGNTTLFVAEKTKNDDQGVF